MDLMPSEKKVLNALVDGEKTFRELAEFFKVDEENKIMTRPALNTALKKLISKGFVQIVLNTQGKKTYKLQPASYIKLFLEEFSKTNIQEMKEYLTCEGAVAFTSHEVKFGKEEIFVELVKLTKVFNEMLEKEALEKLEPEEKAFYLKMSKKIMAMARKDVVKENYNKLKSWFELSFYVMRKSFPFEVARFKAVEKVKEFVELLTYLEDTIFRLELQKRGFIPDLSLNEKEKEELNRYLMIEAKLKSLMPRAVILIPFNFPEIEKAVTEKMRTLKQPLEFDFFTPF